MKKILTLICTLLCANVLLAQTTFWIGDIQYEITSTNPAEVEVNDANDLITTAIIPETVSFEGSTYSVTSIGDSAFYYCSSLTSVTIGNSVTSIRDHAFAYCSSLTSITIPESVTSIYDAAFGLCNNLTTLNFNATNCNFNISQYIVFPTSITTVNIGENVQKIPDYFAYLLDGLTSITIPNSVTSIGYDAFGGCNNLTTLNFNATNCNYLYYAVFPTSITTVNIGENVNKIPNYFIQGTSVSSIDIPNSVTSIGDDAFSYCSSLNSIDIPNSVTSIGDKAFKDCNSLTSVTIPNSVTEIGYNAFYSCSSLTTLNFNAVNCNDFNYIDLDYTHPFAYCPINTINIGNSVQRIPANLVYNLNSLTSVSLDMSSIPANLFTQSVPLQNLTLGENVTSIASGAFNSYSFLQNVTCLATTPPTLADNTVFPYPNIATLTVPCGTLEAYSSATSFWNMFFMGRISEDGYEVEVSVNDDAFGSVAIENNCSTATLTATANACYQFVGWNDGNTENPRLVTLSSDTTLTANFEVMVVNNDITATICEGQVYNENGFNVSEAGTYTQTLQTANGCDSIVTLTVSVNPTFDTTINATINPGETYAEFGFNESEAGTYVQNLQTEAGCDSTITLVLSVNSSLIDIEKTEITFYPNPTDSKITFSQKIEKVEVIDLTGKTIFTFTNAKTINIESLPSGAYYLRLTNDEKTIMQKVIKQ